MSRIMHRRPADPVFDAIERHRAAYARHVTACGRSDKIKAREEGRTVTKADEREHDAADHAEREALIALFSTSPQTAAGARALIDCVSRMDFVIRSDEGLPTLFAALLRSPILDGEATPQRPDADLDKGISPRQMAAMERFDAALAEWLAARADAAARHDDESEDALRQRDDRERAAEMALIASPAPHSTALWQKWGFVEHLMNEELEGGPFRYSAAVVAFASLKADVAALGLKPWPDA